MCNKMVTIPDDVYLCRINPNGISSTSVGNPKVIESFLVTVQLLDDAKTLGLPMTAQLYNMFLRQARMNYNRISTLHYSSIDRYIVAATCRAKRQYLPTKHTSTPHLIHIEQVLDKYDFGKNSVLCSII